MYFAPRRALHGFFVSQHFGIMNGAVVGEFL